MNASDSRQAKSYSSSDPVERACRGVLCIVVVSYISWGVTRGRLPHGLWRVLVGVKALRFAPTPLHAALALTPPVRALEGSYGDRSRVCDAVRIPAFSDGP
jgi:hypothetical protein